MPKQRTKKPPWRRRVPDAAQAERYAAKEAQKQKEVVDVVLRYIVQSPKAGRLPERTVEVYGQVTREELAAMQAADAHGRLWLNYVREQE